MKTACLIPLGLCLLLLVSCRSDSEQASRDLRADDRESAGSSAPLVSRDLAVLSSGHAAKLFSLVTDHGVDFKNQLSADREIPYLANGSGLAIGDVDANGLPDVFVCGLSIGNRLFLQTAPFQFRDATESSCIQSSTEVISAGAAMCDADNDGRLDIYVCNYLGPNELYLNQGSGEFLEVARDWGLDSSEPTTMAAFMDYDGDGDQDVYLLNNRRYKAENDNYQGRVGKTAAGEIIAPEDLFLKMDGHLIRSVTRTCCCETTVSVSQMSRTRLEFSALAWVCRRPGGISTPITCPTCGWAMT